MLPPAPGLFSATTGWPQLSVSFTPMARAKLSAMPPTAKVTTILIGFEGYCCAPVTPASASVATAINPARVRRRSVLRVMSSSVQGHAEQVFEILARHRPRVGRGRVVLHRALDHARN